jgi:hypothetical protein
MSINKKIRQCLPYLYTIVEHLVAHKLCLQHATLVSFSFEQLRRVCF